jgi:hypothetical protein
MSPSKTVCYAQKNKNKKQKGTAWFGNGKRRKNIYLIHQI